MDEETKFIHNLVRLAGPTNAVTVDFMLDTLLYINKNSIVEAQFIEVPYLESMFDDQEFLQHNNIQNLINNYEEAKRNSDDIFLTLLHQKHKLARMFLENEVIKKQIKDLIEVRKKLIENKLTEFTITNILQIVKYFPNSKVGQILQPLLPELMESIIDNENSK